MEVVLQYVLLLFVLSQVSERIANMFKLYIPNSWFGNLDAKERNAVLEKIRERKIFFLSIVAGVVTTIIFFLTCLLEPIPWLKDFSYYKGATLILLPLFLSFGSKFWHDLLDILYLYKNLNRVVRSGELIQAESSTDAANMLKISSVQIARKVLAEKRNEWMSIPGVIAVGIGAGTNEEPTIRIYYQDGSEASSLPVELPYSDDNGIIHLICIEKILSGAVLAQSAKVGAAISLNSSPEKYGTMGFLYKDKFNSNRYFGSTCYHVLRPANQSWSRYIKPLNQPDIICQNLRGSFCDTKSILIRGGRNNEYDAVLFKIESIDQIIKDSLPKVSKSAKIDQGYVNRKVNIQTLDNDNLKDNLKTGYIHEWKTDVIISYGSNDKMKFVNFFSIRLDYNNSKSTSLRSVTKPGDSGSAVYSDGEAIGMVVGGSQQLTYCVKISTLEEQMGILVLPHPSMSPSNLFADEV